MRHNPSSGTGWVDWASVMQRYQDSGEGGMAVYAVLPEDDSTPESFVACIPYTTVSIRMLQPDVAITHTGLWPERMVTCCHMPESDFCGKEVADEDSAPLLLAMCLGGSGGSWYSPECDYFDCAMSDLTSEGQALLSSLTRLYGRCPTLVTVLDT